MSDYRMRLIVKIKVSYDKYLKWRDEFGEAAEYAFLQAQFTGYENYLLSCRSEDKLFDMMVSGHRGTHIKP